MLPVFASASGFFSTFILDPNPVVAGQPLTISISIKPGETAPANWVGHITFRVYDPADNLIYTSGSSISSENNFASATFTPPTAGMYELQIDYDSPYDGEGVHYGADLPVIEGTGVPEANAGGSYQGNEGFPVTFDASLSSDPDGNALQYRWDFESDGTWDTAWSNEPTATHIWNDEWSGNTTLEVSDGELTSTDTANVTIINVNPVVGKIESPIDPVPVNTQITTSCTFTDVGLTDTHTGIWDWGDGKSSGYVSEANGAGTITGEHVYANPGVYRVTLTITDDGDGSSSVQTDDYVVIYNPEGGFVTGGGWINSPAGAFLADENLEGKATFGFVSKYQKGATVPTGNTEFQFKVADLNFKSTSYDWLVVSGPQAKYKGSGTINGDGNYGFLLSAVDGAIKGDGIDKFRIKIWDKETDETFYDNEIKAAEDIEPSTAIDGGSIIIHK